MPLNVKSVVAGEVHAEGGATAGGGDGTQAGETPTYPGWQELSDGMQAGQTPTVPVSQAGGGTQAGYTPVVPGGQPAKSAQAGW